MKKCNHCESKNVEFKEMLTFSYWYCLDCKKEVGENLSNSSERFTFTSDVGYAEVRLPRGSQNAFDNLTTLYNMFDSLSPGNLIDVGVDQHSHGLDVTSCYNNISDILSLKENIKNKIESELPAALMLKDVKVTQQVDMTYFTAEIMTFY